MKRTFTICALILLACSLSTLGQQAAPVGNDSTTGRPTIILPRERIENLGKLKQQVKNYYECTCTCGCYGTEIDEQTDRAIGFLRKRVQQRTPGERLAIVLDIDETALSNYQYLLRSDFTIEPSSWNQWVEDGQATAIAGTLRIFGEARKSQVSIFFITGRRESQREATERTLRARGYENWDGLTLRLPEQTKTPAAEYKAAARQKIIDRGFHIALNVGDQLSDLDGAPQAELSVKLPDPFYYIP